MNSLHSNAQRTGSGQSGFTLIEVMVVVVILGILAALIVPNVIGQGDKARAGTTVSTLATVSNSLDLYRLDNSKYPTTQEGLDALINKPASASNWLQGGYIKGGLPKDGWGNDLQYISPGSNGRAYDLYSFGADGKEGGSDLDQDLSAK
ncbi:MAG: type II secretion system major pseudopilin GspG [Moraxellaceae bacterium]